MVKLFLDFVTTNHAAISSDVLNDYLMKHYTSNGARKRAGNEIVRFSVQALGMKQGDLTFVRPI